MLRKLLMLLLITWGNLVFSGATISLDEVIVKSLKSSPTLLAADATVEAARAQDRSVGFLSAPSVAFSWMGQDGPFKTMDERATNPSWSISQSFPFPTTWWQRKKALAEQSRAAVMAKEWKLSELRFRAIKAFWAYAQAHRVDELLDEEIAILKRHKKNTTLRPVSNELVRAHLFEIDEDMAMLENRKTNQLAQIRASYFDILELTGEKVPNEFPKPLYNFQSDLLSATEFSLAADSRVIGIKADILSQRAKVSEAKSKFAPNLNLSFKSYSENSPMPGAKELMVGISLPFVYFWQSSAGVSQEKAKLKVLEAKELGLTRELENEWNSGKVMVEATSEILERLKNRVIPSAQKRFQFLDGLSASQMETLMQRYAAGKKLIEYKTLEMENLVKLNVMSAWLASFGVATADAHTNSVEESKRESVK